MHKGIESLQHVKKKYYKEMSARGTMVSMAGVLTRLAQQQRNHQTPACVHGSSTITVPFISIPMALSSTTVRSSQSCSSSSSCGGTLLPKIEIGVPAELKASSKRERASCAFLSNEVADTQSEVTGLSAKTSLFSAGKTRNLRL